MQLKKRHAVSVALAAATSSLLGVAIADEVGVEEVSPWRFDTALLYYGEADSRVDDASFSLVARREFRDENFLDLKLAVDVLTGATPSGATPAGAPQTFTRPSGSDQYTVAPGDQPLDDTFKDTRVALSGTWQQPLGDDYDLSTGLSFSDEYDYTHIGVNLAISRDLNRKNTTLSAGLAYSSDSIDPVGGAPIGLAPMRGIDNDDSKMGDDDKDVVDVLLGVTQVIDARTVAQLNYSLSRSSGYLSDPYKLLSVLDPVTGDPIDGPDGLNLYLYEQRPDSRTKHSLYGKVKRYFDPGVLDLSYRFMTDDWGIDSHTVEMRYRWRLNDVHALEPHVRYYTQSEADLYRSFLVDGETLPAEASPDYRLADFDGITLGLKWIYRPRATREMSVRAEYYTQSGDASGSFGSLDGYDLYPGLDAVIAQFSYRWGR